MPIYFDSNVPVIDPKQLSDACRGRRIPVDLWYGKANLFRTQPGRVPGRGQFLLMKSDLDSLTLTTDHTLTFADDGNTLTIQRLTIVGAECVVPGAPNDPSRVYLVDVVDRRWHLARVPINLGYNLTDRTGTGTYLTGTTNSGTAWTWATLVANLLSTLGISAGSLPFTPHGTPENFEFWGYSAWYALNDILDRIACTIDYDHTTDTFRLVRVGSPSAGDSTALATLQTQPLKWDGAPVDVLRAVQPAGVRVLFRKDPPPTDGSSPFYDITVSLSGSGVVSDTVVTVRDDLTALLPSGTTPTNVSTLNARASERASDWQRKLQNRDRRVLQVYRDLQPSSLTVLGSLATETTWEDRSEGLGTELVSGPWDGMGKFPDPTAVVAGIGGFYAKLTGGTGPYSWTECTVSGGTVSGARTGSLNATEATTGLTGIPVDGSVIVWMSGSGSSYSFNAKLFTFPLTWTTSGTGSSCTWVPATTKTVVISGQNLCGSTT